MSKGETKNRIGRYEIVEEIGRGGMASVFRAVDTALNRDVALKLLHPHLAKNKEARTRFQREAHAVARLHNPAIVEVYDYSEEDDEEVFIVMELVHGTTLREILNEREGRPMPAEGAAIIARQIFAALGSAHENGIIHRDVKPENILISDEGTIKLSDFGIAHLAGLDQMTVTGQILGSPAFMSPEHIEMAELDARADIFSVGILLYEMSVGNLPFHGNNPHQIIKRIVEGYYDHPLSVRPAVGHHVAAVIVRCLQQDRNRRYSTAHEAVNDLDHALDLMRIGPVNEELASFFVDPDGWEEEKRKTIVARTLEIGQEARRAKRLPEAMDHLNRVLALEPGNEKALDAVAGLSRRRRLKRSFERLFVALAVLLSFAAIIWAIFLLDNTDEIPGDAYPPKEKIVVAPKIEDAGQTEKTMPVLHENDAGSKKSTKNPATKGIKQGIKATLAKTKIKTKKKIIFNPYPMRVEIQIDDNERFVFKTTDRSRMLTEGEHKIDFIPSDSRMLPLTKTVTVTPGEGSMSVGARLRWKPATLKVNSNIPGGVAVDGRPQGNTGRAISIPLKDGPEQVIKLLVNAKGYHPETRQVTITAGDKKEVTVSLLKGPPVSSE